MTKKDKELILFWLNEKAVDAHTRQANINIGTEFWRGQYMALNEVYSMITNIQAEDEETGT